MWTARAHFFSWADSRGGFALETLCFSRTMRCPPLTKGLREPHLMLYLQRQYKLLFSICKKQNKRWNMNWQSTAGVTSESCPRSSLGWQRSWAHPCAILGTFHSHKHCPDFLATESCAAMWEGQISGEILWAFWTLKFAAPIYVT